MPNNNNDKDRVVAAAQHAGLGHDACLIALIYGQTLHCNALERTSRVAHFDAHGEMQEALP